VSATRSRLSIAVAALFLVLSPALTEAHAQDARPAARVVEQIGVVTALRGGQPRTLRLAASLFQGDHIVTGPQSRVRIELADGSLLSLGAGTRVALTTVAFDADGRGLRGIFKLVLGILRSSLSGVVWRDGFSVETRAAVASVRSTDFVTEVLSEKSSVFVVDGLVEVLPVQAPAVPLVAGEGVDVPLGATRIEVKVWGQKRVDDVLARTRVR